MKRSMGGGSYRGPLGAQRQRRTIRFMQVLLVITASALLMFAGYAVGRVSGYKAAGNASTDGPKKPGLIQPIVLVLVASVPLAGAFALQRGGALVVPTPARLDELAGRAEGVAVAKAGSDAKDQEAPRAASPQEGT